MTVVERLSRPIRNTLARSHQAIKKLSKSHLGRTNAPSWKPGLESLEARAVPSAATPDVDLSTRGATGSVNGAVFTQYTPQPTGTGYIRSFLRVDAPGNATLEQGYNTDARPLQFDEMKAANFTRAIRLNEVAEVTSGGTAYRGFLLDINQSSKSPLLSLDQLRIYVGTSGSLTGYDAAAGTLAGLAPVYDLDAGGDHWIELNAKLSSGSGSGDMVVYVPNSAFAGAGDNPYVYLFCRFGDHLGCNGGFEEWSTARGLPAPTPPPAAGPATLSGYVFIDSNLSGVHDNGDYGFAGMTVTLTGTDASGHAVTFTTTTDVNGYYSFADLAAGTYTVSHQTPVGYYDSGSYVGTVGGSSDGTLNADGTIGQVVLKAGDGGLNYNFAELNIPGA